MAEITTLEEKLAEVLGLAQAAQVAGEKVAGLVEGIGATDVPTPNRRIVERRDGGGRIVRYPRP